MRGFDIFDKASTDCGSSGFPLITRDGEVIGIHKCRAADDDDDQYNVAVSTKAVHAAIWKFKTNKTLPRKFIYNPTRFDKEYES